MQRTFVNPHLQVAEKRNPNHSGKRPSSIAAFDRINYQDLGEADRLGRLRKKGGLIFRSALR